MVQLPQESYSVQIFGIEDAFQKGEYSRIALQRVMDAENVLGIRNLHALSRAVMTSSEEILQPYETAFVIANAWRDADDVVRSALDVLMTDGDVKPMEIGFHKERFRAVIAMPSDGATKKLLEELASRSSRSFPSVYGLLQFYLAPAKK